MKHAVLHPQGVEVSDFSPAEIDDEGVAELAVLLAEYGVVVLPEQHIDDAQFVDFLKRFGSLTFTTGETPVSGFEDLNVISNVGRATPPRSTFHTDSSYLRNPPSYTALRAVSIPDRGGETVFTDQYRAYETLPRDVLDKLTGKSITHVVTGLELTDEDETSAEHAVFRQHPVSGRTALYMSTPKRCAAVSDLPSDEAENLVRYLYEHSTREDNTFRHAWSPGDLVMWDNLCVMHRGDHTNVVGDRVLHRGLVIGYPLAGSDRI